MNKTIDILIPTYNRPAALAVTLTSLCAQFFPYFRVTISDRTEDKDVVKTQEIQAVIRVLEAHRNLVIAYKNLPRRGIAQQRQFLLEKATAPYVIYLDDDVILGNVGDCTMLPIYIIFSNALILLAIALVNIALLGLGDASCMTDKNC
jgi:glycosyltransferase involved in cell wall biosynthesis